MDAAAELLTTLPTSTLNTFICMIYSERFADPYGLTMIGLQALLLRSPCLSHFELHITTSKEMSQYPFTPPWTFRPSKDSIAKLKKLCLYNYDWPSSISSSDTDDCFWNFSQLRSVRMEAVDLDNFFNSIPLGSLQNLSDLELMDRHPSRDRRMPIDQKLWRMLPKLKCFAVGTHWRQLLAGSSLLSLGPQLEELHLDGVENKELFDFEICQDEITIDEIGQLQATYPNLQRLSICLDLVAMTSADFVSRIYLCEGISHTDSIDRQLCHQHYAVSKHSTPFLFRA